MDDDMSDGTAATRIRCAERVGELRTLLARRGRADLAVLTLRLIPLPALQHRSVPGSRQA